MKAYIVYQNTEEDDIGQLQFEGAEKDLYNMIRSIHRMDGYRVVVLKADDLGFSLHDAIKDIP